MICRRWICVALDREFPDEGQQLAMFTHRRGGKSKAAAKDYPNKHLAGHFVRRNKNK